MAGWEEKRLDALVSGATDAIRRSRFVFIAINVAGVIMIIAQFNGMFPWIRHSQYELLRSIPLSAAEATKPSLDQPPPEKPADTIMKLLREGRVRILENDLRVVSIPIVGIKVESSDLGVVGALGMAVLSLWYYYCARRENYAVVEVVRAAEYVLQAGGTEAAAKAFYLYDGVSQHFVFTTLTERDTPSGTEPRIKVCRPVNLLMLIPVWVPLVVVAADVLSLSVPLTWLRILPSNQIGWFAIGPYCRVEIVVREVITLSLVVHNWIRCRNVARFDVATRAAFRKLGDRIQRAPESFAPVVA